VKGNDLGNRVVPKDVLLFEGLLGFLPNERTAKAEAKFRAKGKWGLAVACYETNELLARKIWDLTFRQASSFIDLQLLTYLGFEFAEALEERMDKEGMPFSRVWSEEPHVLARSIAVRPDIRTIYDPNPEHVFLYGGRGRHLAPNTAHIFLGAL
jgi:hypothetical protein